MIPDVFSYLRLHLCPYIYSVCAAKKIWGLGVCSGSVLIYLFSLILGGGFYFIFIFFEAILDERHRFVHLLSCDIIMIIISSYY